MVEKTEGIVLSSIKYSDSSKIVTVFTKEFGKIAFLAKGARNPKSKFGGALEVLTKSQFTFYNKPNNDLCILTNADILLSNSRITSKSEHLIYAMMIVESVYHTQESRFKFVELYELLNYNIGLMYSLDESPLDIFNLFMYEYARLLGFNLILNDINSVDNFYIFSFEEGCFIKKENKKHIFKFNRLEFNYFYDLIIEKKINSLKLGNDSISHFYNFWVQYFSFHFEKKFSLKSAHLLNL